MELRSGFFGAPSFSFARLGAVVRRRAYMAFELNAPVAFFSGISASAACKQSEMALLVTI